jgi:hypothetical protein
MRPLRLTTACAIDPGLTVTVSLIASVWKRTSWHGRLELGADTSAATEGARSIGTQHILVGRLVGRRLRKELLEITIYE